MGTIIITETKTYKVIEIAKIKKDYLPRPRKHIVNNPYIQPSLFNY